MFCICVISGFLRPGLLWQPGLPPTGSPVLSGDFFISCVDIHPGPQAGYMCMYRPCLHLTLGGMHT
ncbi:hypothetical protein PF010_g25074 [Phytophthora fragariae]|uniref:Uncharacterized protein n=1 Tax=Phytophthora fragariae TaxID=53985 RepID=A0A6G0K0X0_9STRA|nr:hypothetical protein PF010_g25074 [Phytophthora fragariae]